MSVWVVEFRSPSGRMLLRCYDDEEDALESKRQGRKLPGWVVRMWEL